MDDPIYKDRYGATVLSVEKDYVGGLNKECTDEEIFFEPDQILKNGDALPFQGGELLVFKSSKPKEGVIRLEGHGGILMIGDIVKGDAKAKFWVKRAPCPKPTFARARELRGLPSLSIVL